MLKLMYITNDPQTAQIAQQAGVDRIFVDLETVGKEQRQGGMNTVQSHHTVRDVERLRKELTRAALLVRVNPIYPGSEAEIEAVLASGADFVMLPYFQRVGQVRTFLELVRGRAKTVLLFETPEAVRAADEILRLEGIDECYIGLNDLHLGYHQKFLFQPLADGTVEMLCRRFQAAGKPYGFGGVARVGVGALPAERILAEHVRLGSSTVILSRSFCNARQVGDYGRMEEIFQREIPKLRRAEETYRQGSAESLAENRLLVQQIVAQIGESIK